MFKTRLATVAGAFAALLVASTVHAQTAHRAWVSGRGTDTALCGAPTAPCRSLQYTHDHIVASGGEIDVLDPAGYGAISISKPISIVNDGVGTAGVQAASGSAIAIGGGANAVILRGLDIEGVGADFGISASAGGTLTVQDCTINGFSNMGVQYHPTAAGYLFVSNTRITNNADEGVVIVPVITSGNATVRVMLTRIEAFNDQFGVFVGGNSSSNSVTVDVTLADSVAASNFAGVDVSTFASGAPTFVMVRNSTVSDNAKGLFAEGGAKVDIAHSTLSSNGLAFDVFSGGVIGSFGDNDVDGIGSLGVTPTSVPLH